jgi:O-antigen ligase
MYNPSIVKSGQMARDLSSQSMLAQMRLHMANVLGLLAGVFAIFCLLVLPVPWNIRIPLYLTVAIWTVLRPRVALYLLPIAVPWGSLDTLDVNGLNLTSSDILVGLFAASWLAGFVLRSPAAKTNSLPGPLDHAALKESMPTYLISALLFLLLAMLVSMVGTVSAQASLKEIIKWLEFLIVVLLGTQYLRTRRQIWTLVTILFLAAISQACYGYIQYFLNLGPQAFVRDASLRVYGTFGQPNPFAGYINMTLTIAIALMLLGKAWATRILGGATALLLGSAEYLSQSRGGEIAIAIALLFIVTVGIPRLRPLMGTAAIATLGVVAGYLGGIVPERLLMPILRILGLVRLSFTSPNPQDYATAERLAHWIAGINIFLAHPITGVGIGNYPAVYPQYYITIFVNALGHAHNYYINIAAETGVVGLTAFLLFLTAVFVAGSASYRAVSRKYWQVKAHRAKPKAGTSEIETRRTLHLLKMLTNDRTLAIGLLAALLTVCVHNIVDDLYVHSMTNLFALLLILLIRLEGVTSNVASNGGRLDY